MLDRLPALSRDPRLLRAADALLVLGILVGAVLDIFTHRARSGWGGPRPVELASALAISLPLLWRRTHPIAVLVAVGAGGLVDVALVAPRQPGFEPFVALVVSYYSLGAHERDPRSVVVLVVSLVAGAIPAGILHELPGSIAPTLVWTFAAWLVGRIIRSWRGRAVELERANRELAEQRELQAQAAVAVERGRIARELHDVIAHNVSMMVVQAGAAARVLEGEQAHVRGALDAIETTGRATVDEMRRLLGVLRRDGDELALAPQPGLGDIDALVASVQEAGVPVELRVEGAPAAPLPPALDLTAYRIAQEALTNVVKHAGGARVELTVRYDPAAVEIEVRDDGAGSRNGNGSGGGHGLVGMRERAALWGGRLEAGRTQHGWVVRARLPVESPSPAA
jgi:signal transduction histidine kinase